MKKMESQTPEMKQKRKRNVAVIFAVTSKIVDGKTVLAPLPDFPAGITDRATAIKEAKRVQAKLLPDAGFRDVFLIKKIATVRASIQSVMSFAVDT